MSHGHDINRFWSGYHRAREALEKIVALTDAEGASARAAARAVLENRPIPAGLSPVVGALVTEVFAGIDRAQSSLSGPASTGANVGSASDRDSDEANLEELVQIWLARL